MWYRVGSIAVVNGSTTVTGTGTDWLIGANVGDGLLAPDGKIYEVVSVVSAASLTITPAYTGSTLSGQAYAISPTQSFLRDLATQVSTLVNDYSTVKNTVGAARFADGTVTEPGIKFDADVNTGIRRVSADTMALVAGGADKVTVSPSGVAGITKADVGLSNVDNTTDANKPVSTAQAAAIVTERTAAATLTNKTINLNSNTLVATSAQLAAALTDETGTGAAVFANSPALAGTPTAPTAAVGTNTTQLATTAFVAGTTASQAAIAANIRPTLSVDWTQKPTAAALTAAGWTIARTGEITSFGLPTKAAENLFTRSQDFSVSPWGLIAATRSAVTDESGLTGQAVVGTAAAGYHSLNAVVTNTNIGSANYRIRFLVKAAAYTKCHIGDNSNGRAGAAFDIATGAIIGTGYGAGYVSHSIAAHELGGGLYWCELVMTSIASGSNWTIGVTGYPNSGATLDGFGASYTGDGVSGIEVYAAQFQQGFDGDYIPTTDQPITLYEPQLVTTAANELAYQHDANGQCVGLVQYPGDTNLILQSQDLSNASWTKGNVAVTASKRKWAGSVPFWRVAKTNTSSSAQCAQTITTSITAGSKYTLTVALMADQWGGTTTCDVGIRGVANGTGAAGDTVCTILSGPGSATQVGFAPAIYSITGLSTTVPTLVRVTRTFPLADTGTGTWIYPGGSASTTTGHAVLATRVHLSASPRLMPYIPTTTAAVTRGAQSITLSGSAFTAVNNPQQGTLLAKAGLEDAVYGGFGSAAIDLNGSGSFRTTVGVISSGTATGAVSVISGVAQSSFSITVPSTSGFPVCAYAYAANSFRYAASGVVSTEDTSGQLPPANQLQMSNGGWTGLIQRTELYPRAMTSAELAAITTPGVL